ncbi:MAG: hypothetical protein GY822_10675 [Deltaproteobacteria bacterium]|nr:hypothetical protein [Deltaproteobacteria bacterium]
MLSHVFGAEALGLEKEDLRIIGGLRPLIANVLRDDDKTDERGRQRKGVLLFGTTKAKPVGAGEALRDVVRAYMEARTPLTVTNR